MISQNMLASVEQCDWKRQRMRGTLYLTAHNSEVSVKLFLTNSLVIETAPSNMNEILSTIVYN